MPYDYLVFCGIFQARNVHFNQASIPLRQIFGVRDNLSCYNAGVFEHIRCNIIYACDRYNPAIYKLRRILTICHNVYGRDSAQYIKDKTYQSNTKDDK